MKTYKVNEIFYSIQGEGARAGSANVFIRFADCNLRCSSDGPAGFDCDTEFLSGRNLSLDEILAEVREAGGPCRALVLTGGEPALHLDADFISAFKSAGYYLAIETNGTLELPTGLDWVCVSPKTAIHTLRVQQGSEFKIVRSVGQVLPDLPETFSFAHKWVSPGWTSAGLDPQTLNHCIKLVKEKPEWKLSTQQHKLWKVR